MKRATKLLVAELESLGFAYDRTNSKGVDYYTHTRHREVPVTQSLTLDSFKTELRKIRRSLGVDENIGKRNTQQIKERQAAERAALAEELNRHEAEIATLRLAKMQAFDGTGARLTSGQLRDLEDRVREIEVRSREIQQLMSAPSMAGGQA